MCIYTYIHACTSQTQGCRPTAHSKTEHDPRAELIGLLNHHRRTIYKYICVIYIVYNNIYTVPQLPYTRWKKKKTMHDSYFIHIKNSLLTVKN